MRFSLHPHDYRAEPFGRALAAAGHDLARDDRGDVLLIDFDTPHGRHGELIADHLARDAPIMLIPHGAGIPWAHDGIHPVTPQLRGCFVLAEGYADVMRAYGYPIPLHVTGWAYGPLYAFRPARRVRRVLLAPWHPLEDTWIVPAYADANARAFRALLEVPDLEITVRHIGPLEANGLWEAPGVRYVRGQMDGSTRDQALADAVVCPIFSTFAYLALARGVPLVAYGQDVRPRDVVRVGPAQYEILGEAVAWERWRDLARYPHDLHDGPAADVLHAACAAEPAAFKERFLAGEWDPEAFAATVESLVALGPGDAYAGRALRVVASADEVARRPELLAAFASAFGPGADATLVLVAGGAIDDACIAAAESAIAEAGLSDAAAPDLVLAPAPPEPWRQRALARDAAALLTAGGEPPAWAAGLAHVGADPDALRALAA